MTVEEAGAPVVIREQLKSLLVFMVLYSLFAVGGLAIALDDEGGLWTRFLGVFGLVVGPAGVVWMARRVLVRDQPFLTLTEEGFMYEGAGAFGFVAWSDVTELRTAGLPGGARMVVGRVRDPAALNSQRTPFGRWTARRQRTWGDFVIQELTLAISATELFELMSDYWTRRR